jgi:streptogramin lyase
MARCGLLKMVPTRSGRITTAGVVSEFPIPTASSGPDFITTGPDGALWFTEFGANQIGRITTAGAITEFQVPGTSTPPAPAGAGSSPAGITTGPDGAIWFTEFYGNRIGRLATTVNSHDFNGDWKSDIASTLPGATPAATMRCG